MSDIINDELLDRAAYVKEVYVGTILEDAIDKAIKDNNLDRLRRLVVEAEADIAKDELYGADLMPERSREEN